MARTPVLTLLATALAAAAIAPAGASAAPVLVLDGATVHVRQDPFAGPPDPPPPDTAARSTPAPATAARAKPARATPARAKPKGPTVRAELARLQAEGRIDEATHDADRDLYDAAQATLRRLTGRREAELEAVVANLDALSARGGLTPSRLPLAFLTLERNRQWWSTGRLLAYGERVSFAGSQLLWQSYPGQGIQVQWLGTFGTANGYYKGGTRYSARLRALVDEAVPLASARAGGLAWESAFAFDGGRPQWVSALSQGTAIQALARASRRLDDPTLAAVAHQALGIFRVPPPEGVRVPTAAGAHYLQYSFAPSVRILNGFVQSLNGLSDLATLTGDADAQQLLDAGDAQARSEVPAFDTGAWSLYSRTAGRPGPESDLSYHELLRDFLQGLCDRRRAAGDDGAVFCTTATRFTAYISQPPVVTLRDAVGIPRRGRPVRVPYVLSKLSTVTTAVTRGGVVVAGRRVLLGRGAHVLSFTPVHSGPYALRVSAVDAAGNPAVATGALRVRGGGARG